MTNKPTWRKSSYSDSHGQCVELAAADGGIAVRDSQDPDGPSLTVPASSWRPLLNALKSH